MTFHCLLVAACPLTCAGCGDFDGEVCDVDKEHPATEVRSQDSHCHGVSSSSGSDIAQKSLDTGRIAAKKKRPCSPEPHTQTSRLVHQPRQRLPMIRAALVLWL